MDEKEKQVYKLDNGDECSRAEFIRQEFLKDRGRGEIAKELGVSYNIVYSATANMFNKVHTQGAGRRGIMVTHPETGEEVSRAQVMKELFAKGSTRSEIAVQFEVPYATVYGATKGVEPPEGYKPTHGGKVMIQHPETGEEIARIDYIREAYAAGKSRREIANELGCDYSIVWMATRESKAEDAKIVEDAKIEDDEGTEIEDLEDDEDPDYQ